jgi:LysM repeat protein
VLVLSDQGLLPVDTNPPSTSLVDTSTPAITPADTLPSHPPATATEYTISRGDSFSTIAKKFPGVTTKAIQEANPEWIR